MKLTKGSRRSHKYHICLTTKELLDLDNLGVAWQDLSALIEREAGKLDNASSKSGKEV